MTECPYKKIKLELASCENEQYVSVEKLEDPEEQDENEEMEEVAQPIVNGNHLQVFHVLDETDGDSDNPENDEEGEDNDSDTGWIDTMLDANLPDDLKNKKNTQQYEEKFKSVMEAKGHNHFDLLPEGWVQVTHDSGMPLYLHRSTRVCSASLPYFLGNGSVRKHEIPLGAIPCLNYRIALDKEKEQLEEHKKMMEEKASMEVDSTTVEDQPAQNGLSTALNLNTASVLAPKLLAMPNAKIETVAENFKKQNLSSAQVIDYCKKLFHFKTIRVMRFSSWSARRKFTKNRKHIKHLQRPSLPDGTKLITFPILNTEISDPNSTTPSHARPKKEWIMNPNGKSYVCILHEYVQHALKKQPSYEFKELENAATPYSATVSIDGLNYGVGHGTSKKQAKGEAARVTLEILIPEMREKITGGNKTNTNGSAAPKEPKAVQDLSVFDEIRIEDPRVAEFCQKTTEPSPHAILLTCLQRNYGLGDVKVNYEVNTAKHKKNEFTMTVGKHSAKVFCKNKREGKQQAAQAILQIIHPHIKTWGSLLRLYGNRSVKSFKEKKQEEQEITVLQSKAAINQPNYAILDKLKLEMNKLKDKKASVIPISSFISPDLPCTSGANLNNVNL